MIVYVVTLKLSLEADEFQRGFTDQTKKFKKQYDLLISLYII